MGEYDDGDDDGEPECLNGDDRPDSGDVNGGDEDMDEAGEQERAGEGGSGGDILTALV